MSILTLLAVSVALDGGPTRFLISAAIVIKACSTLVAFLADVSRNGIPSWLAYSYKNTRTFKEKVQRRIPYAKTHRSRCCVDDFLCRQITFVAYKKFVYVLTCVTFDFLEPLFHVVEGLLVRAVVDDDDTMSAAVVAGSDCSETFLASGLWKGLRKKFD